MPYPYPATAAMVEYGPKFLNIARTRDLSDRALVAKCCFVVEGYFLAQAFGEEGMMMSLQFEGPSDVLELTDDTVLVHVEDAVAEAQAEATGRPRTKMALPPIAKSLLLAALKQLLDKLLAGLLAGA